MPAEGAGERGAAAATAMLERGRGPYGQQFSRYKFRAISHRVTAAQSKVPPCTRRAPRRTLTVGGCTRCVWIALMVLGPRGEPQKTKNLAVMAGFHGRKDINASENLRT